MVSNAPFYSGKNLALGKSVPFWAILVFVALLVFISSNPPVVLFGLFVVYGLSGWIMWLWKLKRAKALARRQAAGLEQEPSEGAEKSTENHG